MKVLSDDLEKVRRERDNLLGEIAALKMSQEATLGDAAEARERALHNEIDDLKNALSLSEKGQEVLANKSGVTKRLTRTEASLQWEKSSTDELSRLVKRYKGDLQMCLKALKKIVERAAEASGLVNLRPVEGAFSAARRTVQSDADLTGGLSPLTCRSVQIGRKALSDELGAEYLQEATAEAIWARPVGFGSGWPMGAATLNAISRSVLGDINKEIKRLEKNGEGRKERCRHLTFASLAITNAEELAADLRA